LVNPVTTTTNEPVYIVKTIRLRRVIIEHDGALAEDRCNMILVLDVHLPLNPDSSFTALYGLEPDIELPDADPPKSVTKEDLLKDERIKWVLDDMQDCADQE